MRLERVLRRCRKICSAGLPFWTVAWQIKRVHAPWPAHLATVMTARTIHHDPKRTFAQLVAQMPQEELQALAIHVGQQQKDTGAGGGLHCRIEPEPLVLVLHDPRWTVSPSDTNAVAARS
jgi:hypothetical protein